MCGDSQVLSSSPVPRPRPPHLKLPTGPGQEETLPGKVTQTILILILILILTLIPFLKLFLILCLQSSRRHLTVLNVVDPGIGKSRAKALYEVVEKETIRRLECLGGGD